MNEYEDIRKLEKKFDLLQQQFIDEIKYTKKLEERLIRGEKLIDGIRNRDYFAKKLIKKLEQKVDNCITLLELEGNLEAFSERIDKIEAVLKDLFREYFHPKYSRKLDGEPSNETRGWHYCSYHTY